MHQFAYLKLVGLTFSLLGLGNPKFETASKGLELDCCGFYPCYKISQITSQKAWTISSNHTMLQSTVLHYITKYEYEVSLGHTICMYIYIISCHVISYEIQSYHIISYHIYIIYFMSFHFMIIFYSIILYCNQNIDVHPPSIHRLNALHPLHFACLLQGLQVAFQNGLEHRTTCVSSCVPGESGVKHHGNMCGK